MNSRRSKSGAEFSPDRVFRYRLWRTDACGNEDSVCWILLNPSTADETTNDPTVTRCARRTHAWGYGRAVVVNLFAYRATDPKALRMVDDPVGPGNDAAICEEAVAAKLVICAWGQHGSYRNRAARVTQMLRSYNPIPLYCLKHNQSGSPAHPLYVPYSATPVPFSADAPEWQSPLVPSWWENEAH